MSMLIVESPTIQQQIIYVPADISQIMIVAKENSIFSVVLILKNTGNVSVVLEPAAHSTIHVTILSQLQENQQLIIKTSQVHTAPHSASSCMVKAVVQDSAQLRYEGTVQVTQEARNANAQQQSKCLLLGTKARAITSPHLEIETHEVQCTHGSAISTVSDEHIQLCASRGIDPEIAEKLIIEGFFKEELISCSKQKQHEIIDYLQ